METTNSGGVMDKPKMSVGELANARTAVDINGETLEIRQLKVIELFGFFEKFLKTYG